MFAKILCVDDDPVTQMLTKKVFHKVNFCKEIATVFNGEEALVYLKAIKEQTSKSDQQYPEIIFLDINMPVMGGWEFLETFSQNNFTADFPNTKIIILTSSVDQNDIEKSKNYPKVIDFISKPITTDLLRKIECF